MNEPITVIGVDPGGVTGLAILTYSDHDGPFWVAANTEWDTEYARGQVLGAISRVQPHMVAVEKFVVSNRSGRSRSSLSGEFARDLIGAIKAAAPRCELNAATTVKRWSSDKRLHAAGLIQVTRGKPHARDAVRHALYVMCRRNWCPDPLSSTLRK